MVGTQLEVDASACPFPPLHLEKHTLINRSPNVANLTMLSLAAFQAVTALTFALALLGYSHSRTAPALRLAGRSSGPLEGRIEMLCGRGGHAGLLRHPECYATRSVTPRVAPPATALFRSGPE